MRATAREVLERMARMSVVTLRRMAAVYVLGKSTGEGLGERASYLLIRLVAKWEYNLTG